MLAFIEEHMVTDVAHDLLHVQRVVKTAKQLAKEESAKLEVVVPAAYLHDCFSFPKNHPDRANSSFYAAQKAIDFLLETGYPQQYHNDIFHCIEAHSYSANKPAQSIEAKVVQDADRLDALGAIGVVRCMQVSANFNVPLYTKDDPFCEYREPDDKKQTIDHFYTKLLKLESMMQTTAGKREAQRRTEFMKSFLTQLSTEVN